jgi:hypothetical protein
MAATGRVVGRDNPGEPWLNVETMSRLRQRFEQFVKTLDGFESIDTLLERSGQQGMKRADYLLQNRNIVIEQKVLQSNPVERPQKFVDKVARERGIRIYGTVSTTQVFAGQPDPKSLQRQMVLNLAKIIDDDVANADKQTAQTRLLFNIPDAMGVLILLNETAEALRPDVIHYALGNSFQKEREPGKLRYVANDGVIVIFEANTLLLPSSQPAFPILICASPQTRHSSYFAAFSDSFLKEWAVFNNASLVISPTGDAIRLSNAER